MYKNQNRNRSRNRNSLQELLRIEVHRYRKKQNQYHKCLRPPLLIFYKKVKQTIVSSLTNSYKSLQNKSNCANTFIDHYKRITNRTKDIYHDINIMGLATKC